MQKDQAYKKYCKQFLNVLEDNNIIKSIQLTRHFPDDPKIFGFSSLTTSSKRYSDGYTLSVDGYGFSFTSKYEALFKCLVETIERFSQVCYRNAALTTSSFQALNEEALDPALYTNNLKVRKTPFGWMKGYNVTKNKNCFIPAQLAYYNYARKPKELLLTDMNSTGAAGGFDHTSTLLRAIYEVIERDAFMTMYLTKTPPTRLDLDALKYSLSRSGKRTMQAILACTKRYNLELMLFDITNDLRIPSFLAVVLDKMGMGPSMTFGLHASLSMESAIQDSLNEAFHRGTWLRTRLIRSKNRISNIYPKNIHTIEERALYWAPVHMMKKLAYMFNQNPKQIAVEQFSYNQSEELTMVKERLAKKNTEIFYVDVTLKQFRKLGILVYKAIIPRLQMLILNEAFRPIQHDRLRAVARYFGNTSYTIETEPQPFL